MCINICFEHIQNISVIIIKFGDNRLPKITFPLQRLDYLDGLRGWAALVVVVYHTTWETFGDYMPSVQARYASIANDGRLAVFVFFVISGIVLSYGALATNDLRRVQRMALARYPRLFIPVTSAALLAATGMKLGFFANQAAAPLVHRDDWYGIFYTGNPTLVRLLKWAVWNVWYNSEMNRDFGPFLWTMPIEMLGSAILFSIIAIANGSRATRCIFYIFLFIFEWAAQTFLLPFLYGVLISEIMAAGIHKHVPFANLVGLVLLGLGCLGSIWIRGSHSDHKYGLLAWIVVAGCIISPLLNDLLQTKLSRWLGRLSFPLYLVHSLILFSVGSWMILWLVPHQTRWIVFIETASATILLSLLAAHLFYPVERFAIHASRSFAEFVVAHSRPSSQAGRSAADRAA